MSITESLNWRYATKSYNGQSVSQDKIDTILEAIHLAPSSSGLQPFNVLVINNPELKEKIRPIAFNQQQITQSSHVLIFAAWDNYTVERINKVFERNNTERNLPPSATDDYRNMLIQSYTNLTAEQNFEHAARQTYIALGFALYTAAQLQVDATPMEGFSNAALDELLGLKQQGLKSVTILALGYRDAANDWLAPMKKVRAPKSDFFIELN